MPSVFLTEGVLRSENPINLVEAETSSVIVTQEQIPFVIGTPLPPQSNEGYLLASLPITPKRVGNILKLEAGGVISHSIKGAIVTVALFKDNDASAFISRGQTLLKEKDPITSIGINDTIQVGSTDPVVFHLKLGANIAGDLTINGVDGQQIYGGTAVSFFRVWEYRLGV